MNDYDADVGNSIEVKLEIYKTFLQTAEAQIDRRTAASRFYISIIALLIGGLGLVISNADTVDKTFASIYVLLSSVLGVLIAFAWFLFIRRNRTLNAVKYEVVRDMEEDFGFRPFRQAQIKEQALSKKSLNWDLVDLFAPFVFMIVFIVLFFSFMFMYYFRP
jgi:disulfide bond formation protein DsbB